jgi:hypothetical protein
MKTRNARGGDLLDETAPSRRVPEATANVKCGFLFFLKIVTNVPEGILELFRSSPTGCKMAGKEDVYDLPASSLSYPFSLS